MRRFDGCHWRPGALPQVPAPPKRLRPWLDEPGSLTRRLQALAGDAFNVMVLNEHWARAWPEERLQLRSEAMRWHWVREVLLRKDETALVYARSVIPGSSLTGPLRRLRQLGRQPLGALLFGRYPVKRGPIDIARVQSKSRLGARALPPQNTACWARRSVFYIARRPLLVTEVFLPSLLKELGYEHDGC